MNYTQIWEKEKMIIMNNNLSIINVSLLINPIKISLYTIKFNEDNKTAD